MRTDLLLRSDPLRVLAAAACIAVIAAVGYYGWTEYRAGQRVALAERCEASYRTLAPAYRAAGHITGSVDDWLRHQVALCVRHELR
jgi:hypothetical protein